MIRPAYDYNIPLYLFFTQSIINSFLFIVSVYLYEIKTLQRCDEAVVKEHHPYIEMELKGGLAVLTSSGFYTSFTRFLINSTKFYIVIGSYS